MMFKEMLQKKWVPNIRLADLATMAKIEAEIEEFKKANHDDIHTFYRKFYEDLNSRISKTEERLFKTSMTCDDNRFPTITYDYSEGVGTIRVRGSSTSESRILDEMDAIKRAAASLRLVEIIEDEVDWEIGLYNDFDSNNKELRKTAKCLEYLGGHMEFKRPLINVVIPTETAVDPLGYENYELTAARFNCDRLLAMTGKLLEEWDHRRDRLSEDAKSSPSEKLV